MIKVFVGNIDWDMIVLYDLSLLIKVCFICFWLIVWYNYILMRVEFYDCLKGINLSIFMLIIIL